ncbi:MAG: M28 family peptidase [Promethearchaeota archaeon]|nr:MAG: M28 family peptidase [Candidatus Lokiarchaeota archaeon]
MMEWDNNRALERLKKFNFPRKTGTEALIKARDIIFKDLENVISDTKVEKFQFSNLLNKVMLIYGPIILLIIFLKAWFWTLSLIFSIIFAITQIIVFILIFFRIGPYTVCRLFNNKGQYTGYNIISSIPARKEEKGVLILGAHYDTKSTPAIRRYALPVALYSMGSTTLLVIISGIILLYFGPSPLWLTIFIWIGATIELISLSIYFFYNHITNKSMGTVDNGSGVAIILELAHLYASRPNEYLSLVFIAFDGEELGLLGASAFNYSHKEEFLKRNTKMISIDMIGGDYPLKIITKSGLPSIKHGKSIAPVFDNVIQNLQNSQEKSSNDYIKNEASYLYFASDHGPFYYAGIPSAAIFSKFKKEHTNKDTMDNLKPNTFELCGKLIMGFISDYDEILSNHSNEKF